MEESEENNTPPELKESAKSTTANLVLESSKRQYETAYEKFADWRKTNNVPTNYFSENVILAYLGYLSDRYAPFTLWSIFTLLKRKLLAKHGKDISSFEKVQLYLKKNS